MITNRIVLTVLTVTLAALPAALVCAQAPPRFPTTAPTGTPGQRRATPTYLAPPPRSLPSPIRSDRLMERSLLPRRPMERTRGRAAYPVGTKGPCKWIELCPTISGITSGSGIVANPLGIRYRVPTGFVFQVDVTSAAGGTGPGLNVRLQNSCDDGHTWNDVADIVKLNPGTYTVGISTLAAGSTSISAIQDGTLPNNTAVQGPVGDLWRIKYGVSLMTYVGGSYTFQAFLCPN